MHMRKSNGNTKLGLNSKRVLTILSIVGTIMLASVSMAFASTRATIGGYEYNDYILYNASGGGVDGGAFRADFETTGNIGIRINTSGQWCIYSGSNTSSYTVVPAPSNMTLDVAGLQNNGGYIVVNGNTYYFTPHSILEYFYTGEVIPTDPYYPVVSVYLPYTSGGSSSGVPPTPTVSIVDNTMYWLPDNYTATIIYTSNNVWNGSHTTVSTSASCPYSPPTEGYYKVALNYVDPTTGANVHTDYSNTVHFVPTVPDTDNIFNKIWNTLKSSFASLRNAISTVTGYVTSLTEMLSGVLGFMPADVVNVYWSVVVIALVMTLL